MRQIVCALVITVLLSACQAFEREDTQATLQVDSNRYRTEAASLSQNAMARQTEVMEQAVAAETYVVSMNDINRQLLATVRANDPPTAAVMSRQDIPSIVVGTPDPSGQLEFVQTGVTYAVRDTDGCPVEIDSRFTAPVDRVFMTARARNIRAGTRMSIEWIHDGVMVHSESWTVPGSHADFCLWFDLNTSMIEYIWHGSWEAKLYADGVPVEPSGLFRVFPPDEMSG